MALSIRSQLLVVTFFIRLAQAIILRETSAGGVLRINNYPITLIQAYRILTETQQRMNSDCVVRARRTGGDNNNAVNTTD